mgnify:CR=1 FL=1
MSQPFTYSTTYELDKAHFQECFSESVVIVTSISAYKKSIALTVAGMLLVLFTEMNPYAACRQYLLSKTVVGDATNAQ